MKVLVFPGSDIVGGSEINAVELSAALIASGCGVEIFVRSGKVMDMARDLHIPVREAHFPQRGRPSPLAAWELRTLLVSGGYDVVHAYEGYSSTEAYYATLGLETKMVGTLYTMDEPPYLPRGFPIIAGTKDIEADLGRNRPRKLVHRIDPPVDTVHNAPSATGGLVLRERLGIPNTDFVLSMVSRLDPLGKLEALLDALLAVQMLAEQRSLRLLIAGDGPARDRLTRKAEEVNRRVGRTVVTMLGHLKDPRPAYWAADAVLGMGTSALRGMACGKPCIVVGERGFAQLVTSTTLPTFLQQGFWGRGKGASGSTTLADAIDGLYLSTITERSALSTFGREVVVKYHGLDQAADELLRFYEVAPSTHHRSARDWADMLVVLGKVMAFKMYHRLPAQRRSERLAVSEPSGRFEPLGWKSGLDEQTLRNSVSANPKAHAGEEPPLSMPEVEEFFS